MRSANTTSKDSFYYRKQQQGPEAMANNIWNQRKRLMASALASTLKEKTMEQPQNGYTFFFPNTRLHIGMNGRANAQELPKGSKGRVVDPDAREALSQLRHGCN